MVKTIKHLIFYKDKRFYSTFPAITKLENGQYILIFRRGRDYRHLLKENLSDDAKKLLNYADHGDSRAQLTQLILDEKLNTLGNEMILPIDPEVNDQDASLIVLKNKTIMLGSFCWYPMPPIFKPGLEDHSVNSCNKEQLFLFWGGNVRFSEDNGQSWSSHQYLPVYPGDKPAYDRPTGAIRGQALEADEYLLLPAYADHPKSPMTCCFTYRSKDSGKNWVCEDPIAIDPNKHWALTEPSLHRCPSGKIIAFIRANDPEHNSALATTESGDDGKTWSPWINHGITGCPFHPLKLPDNRVLLTYGYRAKPCGIRARILNPECDNIKESEEFIIRDDASHGDVGYPWSTMMEDGRILVVYYFTGEDSIRHIAGTILEIT